MVASRQIVYHSITRINHPQHQTAAQLQNSNMLAVAAAAAVPPA